MTVLQHLAHPTGWWWLADLLLAVVFGVIVIGVDEDGFC